MDNDDLRIDQQDRIAGWLTTEEWTPRMAAYIFLNLEPECTEAPSGPQGWCCEWICRDRALLSEREVSFIQADIGDASYARDRNLEMELERLHHLISAADPLRVRTPSQWIKWAERNELLPSWLAGYDRDSSAEILAEQRQPNAHDFREHQRRAAARRHRDSAKGRAKADILPLIEAWHRSCPTETATLFADRLITDLNEDPAYSGGLKQVPAFETLQRWIREAKKRLVA